ncbi:MAG TPA: hypothetical protein VHM93_04470, partial [Candidatus Acidoferrum sp.]|nr:hypothetical protein [Candidatus Acidoferrum sp.]
QSVLSPQAFPPLGTGFLLKLSPDGGILVFIYRSREAVKLGCRKILLDKIASFGYSMVDESIRRPTGT